MRLILTKTGLDNVRLNLFRGVCDTCRECRAWDKPGHTVMSSIALPGKDTGQDNDQYHGCVPSVLDAVWTCKGTLLRWRGALKNDTAKAVLKAKGTELRVRARGQHATTLGARNGILRHLRHVMEAELNR
eukprot:7943613-Pyramimonas_sp.AAC.1